MSKRGICVQCSGLSHDLPLGKSCEGFQGWQQWWWWWWWCNRSRNGIPETLSSIWWSSVSGVDWPKVTGVDVVSASHLTAEPPQPHLEMKVCGRQVFHCNECNIMYYSACHVLLISLSMCVCVCVWCWWLFMMVWILQALVCLFVSLLWAELFVTFNGTCNGDLMYGQWAEQIKPAAAAVVFLSSAWPLQLVQGGGTGSALPQDCPQTRLPLSQQSEA